jgi:short-subunit dehydrogenase
VVCPAFFNTHLLDNMRYEDEFETEFAHTTFEHARMTADEVAEAAIRAVEKDRLFCVPQPSAKIGWALERLNPGLFQACLAALIRQPWGKPLFMLMARKGLLQ